MPKSSRREGRFKKQAGTAVRARLGEGRISFGGRKIPFLGLE